METEDWTPSNKASSNDFFGFFCCGTVILLFVNVYGLVVPVMVSFEFDFEDLFSFASKELSLEFIDLDVIWLSHFWSDWTEAFLSSGVLRFSVLKSNLAVGLLNLIFEGWLSSLSSLSKSWEVESIGMN